MLYFSSANKLIKLINALDEEIKEKKKLLEKAVSEKDREELLSQLKKLEKELTDKKSLLMVKKTLL